MGCDKKYIHELLIRLKQDDDEATEPLFACLSVSFYNTAVIRYQLSHEDAQDVIQETFLRIICGINDYDEKRLSGPSWIWRIFGNAAIDQIRKMIKQRGRDVSLDELLEKVQYDILVWELSKEMNPEWAVILD